MAGDDFIWLEEVLGERSLEFAKAHNEETFSDLKSLPVFTEIEADVRKIELAKDKFPQVTLRGGLIYNFWQDADHVRGIWRRTTVESFRSKSPAWEILLDLDALAAKENENWVWKGSACLAPDFRHCLLQLSRGGGDATVVREFDLSSKELVADGFSLAEAKSIADWIDRDTLLVATNFGEGSLTDSGYPRIVRIWKRGEPITSAREVFRGDKTDVRSVPFVDRRPEGTKVFAVRSVTFWESEIFELTGSGEMMQLPLPRFASFRGAFHGEYLFTNRADFSAGGRTFPAGSLLALSEGSVLKPQRGGQAFRSLFEPSGTRFLSEVAVLRSSILLGVLDNVEGKILRLADGRTTEIPIGEHGMAEVYSTEASSDFFLATYADFLHPAAIYSGETSLSLLRSTPARFDASDMVAEQRFATSKDGTRVPFFLVHKKGLKLDGKNPTALYGYGGFEVSMTPWYLGNIGKAWVERGGVYVMANIRGGGEFGPAWHRAAILEKKQNSYDDFIAVAESLITDGVTSPRHLGIWGGSNGGLLVGAVMTQRPELFNAVICAVPLLDMLRYHELPAGASWMAEYGNPEDPAMRAVIEKYSPYQNVRAGVKYPEAFFLTSTKDDRVHPGHARKMVAKMEAQGHKVHYYENTEGGHGGSANLEQRILWASLEFTYLWDKLR